MNKAAELNRILSQSEIRTVFQPIVSLREGAILGYEALSRGPSDSMLASPLALFKAADELGMTWELELICRQKAIERAGKLDNGRFLFINIDPNIIRDEKFQKGFTKEFLKTHNISPDSIIFEITERTAIGDYETFSQILSNYTEQGYKIAIDDTGAGYSGLRTITNTKPHYIKIDMELIRDIDSDTFKQALIKNVVNLCLSTNIKVIAEGIETEGELQTLIRLGVYAGQGYYLQRPTSKFLEIPETIKNKIAQYNSLSNNVFDYDSNYHYIGSLAEERASLDMQISCSDVKDFLDRKGFDGVCLARNGIPRGLIMKSNLNSAFAKQYGVSVFSKRPVSLIMDSSPLIVDYFTPINTVAETAMQRDDSKTYDCIIVTKGFDYCGIVSIKKLLLHTTAMEKNYARELNPLTQLPGNVIISRVLNDLISRGRACCIFYADLDNFKIYNDVYGFENGDKIIKLTATLIENIVKSKFPFNSFVGHIGGDDFIYTIECTLENAESVCQDIISNFDKDVLAFFNEHDIKNGYIETSDRYGKNMQFDLTSISIAGFCGDPLKFRDPETLAMQMGEIKQQVKKLSGSNFIIQDMQS